MESNRKYEIVLDKDIRKFKEEFDQYLQGNLDEDKVFCLDTKSLGIYDFYKDDIETKVYFKKPNNESIYCTCVNTNEYDYIYVVGLANDPIIQTSTWMDEGVTIRPKAAFILNTKDSRKSNLIFAKDCQTNDIFLLLKLDCTYLSDKEIAFLETRNHILINEDNKRLINFGSICKKDHIALLMNIRKFISNVTIGPNSGEYVKLLNVEVPLYFEYESYFKHYQKFYDKMIINQETENILIKNNIIDYPHQNIKGNHRYCMVCGGLIEDSYENKGELRALVGENPKKCSHCVEEILMSYFQSKVLAPYTNKSHLLSDFEDKSVASFYLDLLNENGVIDEGHKFKFIKPLENQSIFFEEIPENYHLETLLEDDDIDYSNIGKLISSLDKETITGNFKLLNSYEHRLYKNKLTDEDGWIIRDMVIDLIKLGHLSNFKQVSVRLKKIIKHFHNLRGIDLVMYKKNACTKDLEEKSIDESISIEIPEHKSEIPIDLRECNHLGRSVSSILNPRPMILQEGK